MVPLDSPHAWDAHWRAWEVIHSRGTPLLPTGYTKATRGGSTATTDDPRNTTTRPLRHFVVTRAYPEVPWDPFSRPTCVGHVQGGLGALAGSHWARGSHFSQK